MENCSVSLESGPGCVTKLKIEDFPDYFQVKLHVGQYMMALRRLRSLKCPFP